MPEADQDAGRNLSSSLSGFQAGIRQRHIAAAHRIDDEGIDLALFLGLHPVVGIERAVAAIAEGMRRQSWREVLDLELGDLAGCIVAGQKTRPADFGSATQRDTMPVPVDNDTSHTRDPP